MQRSFAAFNGDLLRNCWIVRRSVPGCQPKWLVLFCGFFLVGRCRNPPGKESAQKPRLMPRPCAVEIHARGYQKETESIEMPRPCAVEFHVSCSWLTSWR